MMINIAVSVFAIVKWGICGAIIGTITALAYRGTMMIYYANRKVLERSVWKTYKLWIIDSAAFALVMAVFFVDSFSGLSFGKLLLKGMIHSVWIVGLYVAVNFVFQISAFKTAVDIFRKREVV